MKCNSPPVLERNRNGIIEGRSDVIELPVGIVIQNSLAKNMHQVFGAAIFGIPLKGLHPEFQVPFFAVYMYVQIGDFVYIWNGELYANIMHGFRMMLLLYQLSKKNILFLWTSIIVPEIKCSFRFPETSIKA